MRNLVVHSIACGCLIVPLSFATAALATEPQPVDTRGQPVSTRGKPATSSPTDPRTNSAAMPEARSSEARRALELMRRHDLSLEEAIDAAEGHSNGQAVSAEHRLTGAGGNSPGAGTPVVEVVCVDKQNNVALVWIDMATGKVAGSRDLTRVSSLSNNSAWGTSIVKAQDIMGTNVKNSRGESLGEIEDLALDAERGRIAYAVLSFGGIMGINEKLFLVPWAALASQRGETFILDIPKERLTNAPGFDPRQWPNLADVEFARTIHTYYNQPPYWELSNDEVVTRNTTTVATLAPVYKASDFLGRNVVTARNENLGEIEDLAIDPHSGRIAYAVLSFGGFLGINDKLFAIPWSSLAHSMDGKCVLDVDKERLKNAPGFDKNQWPDMANPEWSRSVRDYYKQPSPDRPAR